MAQLIHIRFNYNDIERLSRGFVLAKNVVNNMEEHVWDAMAEELEAWMGQRFDTEGHGTWTSLAPSTVANRARLAATDPAFREGASHKILSNYHDLRNSLSDRSDPRHIEFIRADSMTYGSDVEYALYHEGGYVENSPAKDCGCCAAEQDAQQDSGEHDSRGRRGARLIGADMAIVFKRRHNTRDGGNERRGGFEICSGGEQAGDRYQERAYRRRVACNRATCGVHSGGTGVRRCWESKACWIRHNPLALSSYVQHNENDENGVVSGGIPSRRRHGISASTSGRTRERLVEA